MTTLLTIIIVLIIVIIIYDIFNNSNEYFKPAIVDETKYPDTLTFRNYLYQPYLASDDNGIFRNDFSPDNFIWDYQPLYDLNNSPYYWQGP
jgi:hypothetical protein